MERHLMKERERLNKSGSCFEIRVTIWTTGFIHVKSRYDIGYFLTVSWLYEYRIIALVIEKSKKCL